MNEVVPSNSTVSSGITECCLIRTDDVDISFLARQHRRRLSQTVQLALTAYRACNPELKPLRTVFASRYGEYLRTFGILKDIVSGEGASPAAFSVSVHNTPAGIAGIGTGNTSASSTIAANAATVEAGFVEAVLQTQETGEPLVFIYADEPLPDGYEKFSASGDHPVALGLLLSPEGPQQLSLTWMGTTGKQPEEQLGIPVAAAAIYELLRDKGGSFEHSTGRLDWEWRVD